MNLIDYSNIPIKSNGKRDWINSIGKSIYFKYGKIEGDLIVKDYIKGNKIKIEYNGKEKIIRTSKLSIFQFTDLFDKNNQIKLNTESLPHNINGHIEWFKCKNSNIPFEYYDIKGKIIIKNVERINNSTILSIKYKDKLMNISTSNFLEKKLSSLFEKRSSDFTFTIGERIVSAYKDISILKHDSHKDGNITRKKYYCHCNICGYECWISEDSLVISKYSCPHCAGKVAIKGLDDIETICPWMLNYLSESDSDLRYELPLSNKRFYPKCPLCGVILQKDISISELYRYKTVHCPTCSDTISIGEKFMYALLSRFKIEYIYHCSKRNHEWCKSFIYDFYIYKLRCIVETNGGQHYFDTRNWTKKELIEIQNNDKNKKVNATKDGGVKYYFDIDITYSNLDFIKNSICNSGLLEFLNINPTEEDWIYCYNNALNSLIAEVCKDYNEHPNILIKDLSKKYQLHKQTIASYLRKGTVAGLCEYESFIDKSHRTRTEIIKDYNKKTDFNYFDEAKKYQMAIDSVRRIIKDYKNGNVKFLV